jgi:hypothetical protein
MKPLNASLLAVVMGVVGLPRITLAAPTPAPIDAPTVAPVADSTPLSTEAPAPAHEPLPVGSEGKGPSEPPGAADPALEMRFGSSEKRPSDMNAFTERASNEMRVGGAKARYALNIFGDTFAELRGGSGVAAKPSFGIGGFSLLFTGDLEKSLKLAVETLLEFDDDNKPLIDLERLQIRWTAKNGFWVEAGRTHSDLGYWNNAYHHGKWLQPTIERPRWVHFEEDQGVLPIHWIGLQLGISRKISKDVEILASAAIGNGRGSVVDDLQNHRDKNPAKQGYAKVELKGVGAPELRLGISGLYGAISEQPVNQRPALPNESIAERMGNVYLAYPSFPLFVLSEAYLVSHGTRARDYETVGGFVTAGYSIASFTPYLKVEVLDMLGDDPFFVPDTTRGTRADYVVFDALFGTRIDLSPWCALKTEYRLDYFAIPKTTGHTLTSSWQFAL